MYRQQEDLVEIRDQAPETLRRYIRQRDGRACWYCGTEEARHYVVEHIVPQRRGGPHHPANLVMACQPCNQRKGNRIWRPQNFDTIAADFPEWRAEVERLENPPGDFRKGGPSVTVTLPPYNLPNTAVETISVNGISPQLVLRARIYGIYHKMRMREIVTEALTMYLDSKEAPNG